ncbi:MAG: hypothetical protein IJH64_02120 [Oscillospiraceae bacterium]|nr:hypothetical protein [Oscillospiraceae bacterium]
MPGKKKTGMILRYEWRLALCNLSSSELKRLLPALFDLSENGVYPEPGVLSGRESGVFDSIAPKIAEDSRRYEEKCRQNSANRRSGWKKGESADFIRPYTTVYDRSKKENEIETNSSKEEGDSELFSRVLAKMKEVGNGR